MNNNNNNNITVAPGQTITIIVGEALAPAPVTTPVIETRTANGTTPLFKVRYTSNAGNTATYGVFWQGPARDGSGTRLGLRKLTQDGRRMYNSRAQFGGKGFFVNAADCVRVS